ncbi:cytochrome P450 CYP736A12-like [Senna tora]|uniref:Cytochrome P450 CYP736A12-like n=1 Tax=Senna tora TaxID=362788 RepID=A0A834TQX2_9FABA|nr:cytochrome P450 CYP736A12-like [Senna tora]
MGLAIIANIMAMALLFTSIYFLCTLFIFLFHSKPPLPPPGPPPLPLIGNLHILGKLPHRTLQSLAKTHGSIMSLKLGQVPTVVISSSQAAELIFKTHDVVFANRAKTEAYDYFSYGFKGIAFAEYGPYWRHVRKLCTSQLLSSSKVEMFGGLRKRVMGSVVKSLEKASASREIVNLSEVLHKLTEDLVFKMTFGSDSNKDDAFNYMELVQEGMALAGAFNIADYLPWLRPFDLQGLTRRLKKCRKAMDEVLEKILKEHEEAHQNQKAEKENGESFIGILLSMMDQPMDLHGHDKQHVIDRTTIKAIIVDMFGAALEANAIVLEWAFSELLRHPRVMKNVQDEIESVVGRNRMVEETDLLNFNYLDLVVKETLRLHPAGALIPRESREDIIMDGYFIEKKSIVLVNSWAIGRDPKVWSDNAETFYPERFLDNKVDVRGQHHQLIPFGSGRRRCVGMQMGLVIIKLVLAQLVHCFDWELPHGISPIDLDMTEKFGLTVPRAKQLLAIPSSRILQSSCRLVSQICYD